MYHKKALTIECLKLSCVSLCLICELKIDDQKVPISTLHRFPSQTTDQFDSFDLNFDINLIKFSKFNIDLVILLRNLNAKSSSWCINDTTPLKGYELNHKLHFVFWSKLNQNQRIQSLIHNINVNIGLFTPNFIQNSDIHCRISLESIVGRQSPD